MLQDRMRLNAGPHLPSSVHLMPGRRSQISLLVLKIKGSVSAQDWHARLPKNKGSQGRLKMKKRVHLASTPKDGSDRLDRSRSITKDRPLDIRFDKRTKLRAFLAITTVLSLISGHARGQTTRTNPSASSTTPTIPSSSSTSPDSPCSSTNPSSPCYSANAPRNPCYSAVTSGGPCSTTTTPNSRTSPAPAQRAATTTQATGRAFTRDQAKSRIEAQGYSNVSELRKDAEGIWRGKADRDGLPVSVTLDLGGDVTSN